MHNRKPKKVRDAHGTFIWGGKNAANSEISVMISSRCRPSVPRHRLTSFRGLDFFEKESEVVINCMLVFGGNAANTHLH